ncbi:MAG: YjjG family noncanonical pyrimidine nucleotidase [Fluviicola sp.]|nr:YjjG family noncanonical pyrimidine nucleotidase [Fluviicola sp.]
MKHIFFDLDHTLWDFEKNSEAALRILFEELELGNHLPSFQRFHTKYKKVNAKLWHLYGKGKLEKSVLRVKRFSDTFANFDIKNKELAEHLAKRYVEVSPYQTNLFPDAISVLEELKSNGHQLHIITNGFKEVQYIKLSESKMIDFFDVILCSEEVGKNKPAKEVFHEALSRANAKAEESIMIGDDFHVDVIGAENCGIKGVLFDPHSRQKSGTHEWHIQKLNEIPGLLPWMKESMI